MKYEEAEDIIFNTSYELAGEITGSYPEECGESPAFDAIFDKAYNALWGIIIDGIKAGHIIKED